MDFQEMRLRGGVARRSYEAMLRRGVTTRVYDGRFDGPVSCTRLSAAAIGGVGPDSKDCGARQKSIAEV